MRELARQKTTFVHASAENGQPMAFVFVAPDSAALTPLLQRFAAAKNWRPGLVAE